MIGAFYGFGKDHFANTEDIWEGVFGIIASLIISIMGAALLRVNKLQDKWRVKLARALDAKATAEGSQKRGHRFRRWAEKYSMFMLPFITVLREGLEAVIYIGGVSLGLPASAFPLAVVCGLAAGIAIGYILYRFVQSPPHFQPRKLLTSPSGGNSARLQLFLIISTCFLYLVAAGLFSKSVWYFENNAWGKIIGGDASETGSGPGSYDIRQSVWHVNCCNPQLNGGGGWGIFNALFGWQNSATYGSVISYNLYWICVIVAFVWMRFQERKQVSVERGASASEASNNTEPMVEATGKKGEGVGPETKVQEMHD